MPRGCNDAAVQEYVLDLSISVRTGKETNLDFFSSGERTRRSSSGKAAAVVDVLDRFYGKRSRRW